MIENLENQSSLKSIELGCNRISMIEGLDNCKDTLEELYMGRNRLETLKGIEIFVNLQTLHIPCNRLLLLDFLDDLRELNEIAAAENDLEEIPIILNKNELTVIDLS